MRAKKACKEGEKSVKILQDAKRGYSEKFNKACGQKIKKALYKENFCVIINVQGVVVQSTTNRKKVNLAGRRKMMGRLKELEGKAVRVVVPVSEIVRVQKVKRRSTRHPDEEKTVYLIDFRGIRKGNAKVSNDRRQKYHGAKAAFNSPEKLKKACDDYFKSCYGLLYDNNGQLVYNKKGEPVEYQKMPFTVSGLAYAVGLDTQSLLRYCNGIFDTEMEKDVNVGTFREILSRAKQRIECYAESRLFDRDGNNGARWLLDSSFGRITQKEKTEIEEKRFNMWLKEKEFDLKKQLAAMGDETGGIEIQIVRKEKD